jgi:hypothetical protein
MILMKALSASSTGGDGGQSMMEALEDLLN